MPKFHRTLRAATATATAAASPGAPTATGRVGPAPATLSRRVLKRFGTHTAAAERDLVGQLGLGAADIDNARALRALRTLVQAVRRDGNGNGAQDATLTPELKRTFEAALAEQAPRWERHDPALLRDTLARALHRPLAELDADLQDRLTQDASLASQRMLSIQHHLAIFQQASTAAANLAAGLHEAQRTLIQRL